MSLLHAIGQDSVLSQVDISEATIFIVDDDVSVREALESLLGHEGFTIKSFECATSFLNHPHAIQPCCLLLDISLPGLSGLELQQSLVVNNPALPIVFITGREDVPTVVQAMKAGAIEFLTKPLDADKVLGAVQIAVARSEILVRQELRKTTLKARYAELTRRERQVFSLILQGLLNREIGTELMISEITVKAHRGQVMRKMEAETLAELFRMAGDIGLS